MTDDYTPLTDKQVEAIRVIVHDDGWDCASAKAGRALLADRDYWKRRAEAAERGRCHWCGGDKMLAMPCKNGCDDR